jgi:hypothetical protein
MDRYRAEFVRLGGLAVVGTVSELDLRDLAGLAVVGTVSELDLRDLAGLAVVGTVDKFGFLGL